MENCSALAWHTVGGGEGGGGGGGGETRGMCAVSEQGSVWPSAAYRGACDWSQTRGPFSCGPPPLSSTTSTCYYYSRTVWPKEQERERERKGEKEKEGERKRERIREKQRK